MQYTSKINFVSQHVSKLCQHATVGQSQPEPTQKNSQKKEIQIMGHTS